MLDTEVCDDYSMPSLLTSRAGSLYRFKAVCKTEKLSTFVNGKVEPSQFLRSKMENSIGIFSGIEPQDFYNMLEIVINSSGSGHSCLVQTIYAVPVGGRASPRDD